MGDICALLNLLLNTTELPLLKRFTGHIKGLFVLYDMLQRFRPRLEDHKQLTSTLHGEVLQTAIFNLFEHEDSKVCNIARSLQGLRSSIPPEDPSHANC